MNYCSSPINNMGWWMTLEKLLDNEVPKRAITFKSYCNGIDKNHGIIRSVIQPHVDTELIYRFYMCSNFERESIPNLKKFVKCLTTNMGRIMVSERELVTRSF
jgi:NADH-quinone oxidoreductase subunit D